MTAYSSTIQQDPILPYTHQHLQHFQRPISIKKELKRTTTESYSTEYFCCPTSVQQQTPLRLIDPNYLHISDPISTDRIDNLSNINAEYITPNLYTYPNLQESNFFDLDQYKNDNEYHYDIHRHQPQQHQIAQIAGSFQDLNNNEHQWPTSVLLPPQHLDSQFTPSTVSYYNDNFTIDNCHFDSNVLNKCLAVTDSEQQSFSKKRRRANPEVRIRLNGRYRTPYDEYVKNALEAEFNDNKYISSTRKAELAPQLQLTNRQIKIWFQNRRAKERKLQKRSHRNDIDD